MSEGRLAGKSALITGAAGGTGTACIQLALAAGAVPIAVVGGEEKVALARSLGVNHVVDHRETPAWVDTVREMSGGGVDICFDAVGGDAYHQARRCMSWDGRLLIIGFAGGTIPDSPMNHALLKNYSIVVVHWGASITRDPSSLEGPNRCCFFLTADVLWIRRRCAVSSRTRTAFGMPSQPICLRAAPTSERFRSYLDTPRSRQPRSAVAQRHPGRRHADHRSRSGASEGDDQPPMAASQRDAGHRRWRGGVEESTAEVQNRL